MGNRRPPLRAASGGGFSAKDFRTWGASVLSFRHIVEAAGDAKPTLKAMLDRVAAALGNTPAISRKSYVHPALIDICKSGDIAGLCGAKLPRATRWLSPHERALIAFLDELAALAETGATQQAA